jgi:hypothetical protein
MEPPDNEGRAVVDSTGDVLFIRHVGLKSVCRFVEPDISEQVCLLTFGSWVYDTYMVSIVMHQSILSESIL